METDCCFDHKYSLGSRLSLSTLALSVNSDTEWEMQVLCWKTTEQASGGSRPSDKRWEGGLKNTFSALRASVWSKNKEGPGPPGPLPWIRHAASYGKTGTCLLKLSAS